MPRVIASIATSSTNKVPVDATVYTEQTSGAQRALVSSSANDAAAGTGARTVRVIYYTLAADGTIAGPFVELVTMNGVTAVAMVVTNVALIERIDVLTVGSGGVAAGTISLTVAADGTGGTVCSIATGAVRTFMGHHYVPTGRTCRVTDLAAQGGFTTTALVEVDYLKYPAGAPEQTMTGPIGTTTTLPVFAPFADAPQNLIAGPARLRLLVTPSVDAQTTRASFGFVDG